MRVRREGSEVSLKCGYEWFWDAFFLSCLKQKGHRFHTITDANYFSHLHSFNTSVSQLLRTGRIIVWSCVTLSGRCEFFPRKPVHAGVRKIYFKPALRCVGDFHRGRGFS